MMTRMQRRWLLGFALAMIALIPLGLRWQGTQRDMETLVIADASQFAFLLVYLAEEQGYFEDEGLTIRYKTFLSGRDALAAAMNGEADIATVFETPVARNIMQGKPIAVLSTLHHSSRNTALLARTDRGIHVVSDLKGKRIAVTPRTNGAFFLQTFLTSHGIPLAGVNLIETAPGEMADALQSGRVDAIASWQPHLLRAVRAVGEENTRLFQSDVYTELSVLAGLRTVVESRREALIRLYRALLRAEERFHQDPGGAFPVAGRRLGIDDPAMIRAFQDTVIPTLTLDNVLLTILRQEAVWFLRSGDLSGAVPNYRNFLFTGILEQVKPEYVTVQ